MKKRLVVLFSFVLLIGGAVMAADLPSKGKTPPTPPTTRGPGGYPDDPSTPIGGGLAILFSMSVTYVLVKRKKRN